MWYVIQVFGGKEQTTLDLLKRFVDEGVLQEAFVPRREVMRRNGGVTTRVIEVLFPGYLFVVTETPRELCAQLKGVPAFTRMLGGSDKRFIPLNQSEIDCLEEFCGVNRVVEMSHGVIEGDQVRVSEGPLKGHEGIIKKIDRHKQCAYVDMEFMGRTKSIKLGLEIVRKNS